MPKSKGRASEARKEKDRASRSAALEVDECVVCVAPRCMVNTVDKQTQSREAVESVRRQIAAEKFVDGDEDAHSIKRVATQIRKAVVVCDVGALQNALPDVSQHFDRRT